MKIAVVAPLVAPLSDAQAYGNHAVLIDLARGLADRGHDVRVFAAAGSSLPRLTVEQVPVERAVAESFIVPGRAADRRSALPGEDAMRRAFETLADRVVRWMPDAISAHAFDVEAIEVLEGLPVVHTLHLPPIVPAVVDAIRASRAPFVAVSASSRAIWEAAGVATNLVRNGVPDLLREEWAPLRGRPDVAIVAGRISREKGTVTAVRVARRAALRPHVIGSDYDREYAEREVLPLLRPDERMAPVTRAELGRRMAEAAVTLMPVEWDEPFGLVAAEAQMAGCPVVAYRRGALPEIVTEGTGGFLVAPGDEDALVAACGSVAELDREAIRRDALARLSLGPMIDGHERLLRELA